MKRILLAFSILIFSTAAFAQSEKVQNNGEAKATMSEYEKAKADQKAAIFNKYEDINASIEKDDLAGAKQKYADAQKMMEQSLESDKKFLRAAKTEAEKSQLTRKIDTKQRLYDASKDLSNATDAKAAKRYAIFVMEFANVTQIM